MANFLKLASILSFVVGLALNPSLSLVVRAQSYVELAPWDQPSTKDPPGLASIERFLPSDDRRTERALAVDGTQFTVLTPIFLGEDNNYSYIRFPNGTDANATFYASVVGSPSAENYGTAVTTVAPFASPQFSINDILDAIGSTGLAFGDDSISVYMSSPQGGNGVGFQHVIWNSLTGFFENASICNYIPDMDYSILNRALINVHTSRIPSYPGIVFLHNYANFPITYLANIFDARDGMYLGSINFNMLANETFASELSLLESLIDFVPLANQYHVNILFEPYRTEVNTYTALAAQGIDNLQLSAYTNMSVYCAINPSQNR